MAGLGAVDLATGEVKVLESQILGFKLGNFFVHCDWEEAEKLELLIFCHSGR